MRLRIESLEDLRVLTDAVLANLPERDGADLAVLGEEIETGAVSEMDPLIDEILRQAESSDGEAFDLELEGDDEERLVSALEKQMEAFASAGDLFQVGELQAVLRELGRG